MHIRSFDVFALGLYTVPR